jgi:ketosteroid isomerase-like protein
MASDDLELIRWAFEHLDSERFESVLPSVAEDFEMTTTAAVASEPDVYRGPEGVRRWWESFLDAMDSVRLEAGRFIDVGAGQAIVEFEIHARGKQSGIDVRQPAIALATVADGKLSRLEFFLSLEEAQAAARSAPG